MVVFQVKVGVDARVVCVWEFDGVDGGISEVGEGVYATGAVEGCGTGPDSEERGWEEGGLRTMRND